MKAIPGMTVTEHHECCIGLMNLCYPHVPEDLKAAIMQGLKAAAAMGMDINPELAGTGEPLHNQIRMTAE